MGTLPLAAILELPVEERVRLAQTIWDSICELPDPYPLSEKEREVLNRRLEAYRRNPQAVSPWPEVKQRILNRA